MESKNTFKITVLISGSGTNLQEIIDHLPVIGPNVMINQVISNRRQAYGLARAEQAGISALYCPYRKDQENRDQYQERLRMEILKDRPNLIVCAGWMHILGEVFLKEIGVPIINLHPALPGQFPGVNAIGQAWKAYQDGKMGENPQTGCMIHYVIPEIDAGEVIEQTVVPIHADDTLESLTARVRYVEKPTLIRAIIKLVNQVQIASEDLQLTNQYPMHRGKVRNMLKIGHSLLAMVHSNRFSSFDRHICDVPNKGANLCRISAWWFRKTRCIIPNHYCYHTRNLMIVKEVKPIPIEVVVRGYITGSTNTSLWTNYARASADADGYREYCGLKFPPGLVKHQQLEKPVVTPTTKDQEHDVPISAVEIIKRKICTPGEWEYIERKALELFDYGTNRLARTGLILVDTKMEFGRNQNGKIVLIDEIFTPDSSRFWKADSYLTRMESGKAPERLDKDLIREYIMEQGIDPYDPTVPIPTIPDQLIKRVSQVYTDFFNNLHSSRIAEQPARSFRVRDQLGEPVTDLEVELENYFHHYHSPICIIMIDDQSTQSLECAKQVKAELRKMGIYSSLEVVSPYRETGRLLCLLDDYCEDVDQGRKMVFCVVSSNPGPLASIISGNSAVPVMAFPTDRSNFKLGQVTQGGITYAFHPSDCADFMRRTFNLGKYRRIIY